MDEKRYSLRTAGKILNVTAMAIQHRARMLGIDTSAGITAANVRAIRDYKKNQRYATKSSAEDLARELEALDGK